MFYCDPDHPFTKLERRKVYFAMAALALVLLSSIKPPTDCESFVDENSSNFAAANSRFRWDPFGLYDLICTKAYELVNDNLRNAVLFSESVAVFDWLPASLAARIGKAANGFGLTDLVRLPQKRNCLLMAPARHPLRMLLRTDE